MGIEIEHKYLVVNDKYRNMASSSHRIMQGYLSREPQRTVRIRVKDNQGFITIKGKNVGDTRAEFEYPIPIDDAMQLLNMCLPTVIEKTRYLVPFEGHTWEVDEFHGVLQKSDFLSVRQERLLFIRVLQLRNTTVIWATILQLWRIPHHAGRRR